MYAALDHGILFPRSEPFQAQNERRDSEKQTDHRQAADDTEIVGDQRVWVLLRNDSAGGVAFRGW